MSTNILLPELLAPAGSMERFESALIYGANAVYLGGRDHLNLRHGALGFSWQELDEAIIKAKSKGVKIYYCINAFPRQDAFDNVDESLERLSSLAIDGLIVADGGVFRKARKLAPNLDIHVSTQANTASAEAALFWHEQGATRVNLARELDMPALRQTVSAIKKQAPSLECEVFVHGAMCLAISGQCLLSAWLNQRPGNLGQCTHPCRFEYRAKEYALTGISVDESLRQSERGGEPIWEIADNEDGFSAFWSPQELCLIKYLPWLARLGVNSLKLEGRMRTAPVVAQMVNIYRTALNDFAAGNFRPNLYLRELGYLASRPMGSGFFLPRGKRKVFSTPQNAQANPVIVARLERKSRSNSWIVQTKSPWSADKPIEIILPNLNNISLKPGQYALENHRGEMVSMLHPGTEAEVYLETDLSGLEYGMFIRTV